MEQEARMGEIKNEGNCVALYHRVYAHEGFEHAAKILFDLVRAAQDQAPNKPRQLFLDIDGHRNTKGGFDADMAELQTEFLATFLLPFLTVAHTPLLDGVRNPNQRNDLPQELIFRPAGRPL
jgi:hypothetical protein